MRILEDCLIVSALVCRHHCFYFHCVEPVQEYFVNAVAELEFLVALVLAAFADEVVLVSVVFADAAVVAD